MQAALADPYLALTNSSLGVPFMDAEHDYLVMLFDNLARAIASPASLEFFAKSFRDLVSFAREHFAHEEYAMHALGYNGYLKHKRVHDQLLANADDFACSIATHYRRFECFGLTIYVWRWLEDHVRKHDKAFAEFVRTSGVSCDKTLLKLPVLPPCAVGLSGFCRFAETPAACSGHLATPPV